MSSYSSFAGIGNTPELLRPEESIRSPKATRRRSHGLLRRGSNHQPLATLRPPTAQDSSSTTGLHPRSKPMDSPTTDPTRLVGALQSDTLSASFPRAQKGSWVFNPPPMYRLYKTHPILSFPHGKILLGSESSLPSTISMVLRPYWTNR